MAYGLDKNAFLEYKLASLSVRYVGAQILLHICMHVIVYSDHLVVANLSEVLDTRCLASGSGPFQNHGKGANSDNASQLTKQVLERGCQNKISFVKVIRLVLSLWDHVTLYVNKAIILGLFLDHKLR